MHMLFIIQWGPPLHMPALKNSCVGCWWSHSIPAPFAHASIFANAMISAISWLHAFNLFVKLTINNVFNVD